MNIEELRSWIGRRETRGNRTFDAIFYGLYGKSTTTALTPSMRLSRARGAWSIGCHPVSRPASAWIAEGACQ